MRLKSRKKTRYRWVIKAGSQMVCSGGPGLAHAWMADVRLLRQKYQIEVLWVTSGAIASAAFLTRKLGSIASLRKTLRQKQALSAIGQPVVMDLYSEAMHKNGILGAQVLLTASDLKDSKRRANFVNAANQLLEWSVLPVLNENDAVATEEIQFGDNDQLSARVAAAVGADRLVILTDVEGLYDGPPSSRGSRLVRNVGAVTQKVISLAEPRSASKHGTGGMYSKLLAARLAQKAGIETWLVRGDRPSVLSALARGEHVGTRIAKLNPKL